MTDETEELHRDWDSVKTSKKLLTPDLYFVRPKTGKDEKKRLLSECLGRKTQARHLYNPSA